MGYSESECVFCLKHREGSSLQLCPYCLAKVLQLLEDEANDNYISKCLSRSRLDSCDLIGDECDLCDTKGFAVILPCCADCVAVHEAASISMPSFNY